MRALNDTHARHAQNDIPKHVIECEQTKRSKRMGVKGRLNTDTSPQNFWTTFLENDLTEQLKKSAVANAIAIPFLLCFSCFVLLRRFREELTKPFCFYLSRTCGSPGGTPSVINLALRGNCSARYIDRSLYRRPSVSWYSTSSLRWIWLKVPKLYTNVRTMQQCHVRHVSILCSIASMPKKGVII